MLHPTLVLTLALAGLLAGGTASALAATEDEPHSAWVELDLPANHGLDAHLEALNGEVTLELEKRHRYASYTVDGESTEAGLKARFGELGSIDLTFTPTETRKVKPPKGCVGEPSESHRGVFTGTVDFTGEREFVRIETTEVEGTMDVIRESEWRCPKRNGPKRSRPPSRDPRTRAGTKREPATLWAVDRRCGCYFGAVALRNRRGRGLTNLFGGTFEKREGMAIYRATGTRARAATFTFDHKAGTARVRPPSPFRGGGFFKRRPHKRDIWRGTIRVPVLGADPVVIGGRTVRARLVRALPSD
ncbi:MAG: hypothetical protein R2725_12140 [Solirubrobacterales bacterium]